MLWSWYVAGYSRGFGTYSLHAAITGSDAIFDRGFVELAQRFGKDLDNVVVHSRDFTLS